MDSHKRLDFELRVQTVYDAIERWAIPLSMQEIAAACGLKRTPYLRGIVEGLVESGHLRKGLSLTSKGQPVILYWTPSGEHAAPPFVLT